MERLSYGSHRAATAESNWILMGGCGWLYDALPKQVVWRPRLAVDKGLAPSSLSLATDTKRLATDKQSVWQQTFFFFFFFVVVCTTEGR